MSETLLVDRFVLAGTELLPSREVRYRRSRNRHRAASATDTLGTKDMEGTPSSSQRRSSTSSGT